MPVTQLEKGNAFVALHQSRTPFVVGNAWDAGSARIIAGMGFSALATSSWASGNVYGRKDHAISREEAMVHCRAIAGATDLPVTADLENGFGKNSAEVAETYRQAAAAGLVGASIEDVVHGSDKDALFDINEATDRVAAAVDATCKLGFPFVLTARCDGFIHGHVRLDDTIRRLQAYEAAGAAVLMAPGLPDLGAVKEVCAAISKPFNFMAGIPGKSFSVSELGQAGVRRISVACTLYTAAMTGLIAAAREVRERGTFEYLRTSVTGWDLDEYMQS